MYNADGQARDGQAGRRADGQTDGIAEQRVTGHWIKYARGITLDMVGDVL